MKRFIFVVYTMCVVIIPINAQVKIQNTNVMMKAQRVELHPGVTINNANVEIDTSD